MWTQRSLQRDSHGKASRNSFLFDDRSDKYDDRRRRGHRTAHMDSGESDEDKQKSTYWSRQLQKAEETNPDRSVPFLWKIYRCRRQQELNLAGRFCVLGNGPFQKAVAANLGKSVLCARKIDQCTRWRILNFSVHFFLLLWILVWKCPRTKFPA